MNANLLSGKEIAAAMGKAIQKEIQQRKLVPKIDIIMTEENQSFQIYAKTIERKCTQTGIQSQLHIFPSNIPEKALIDCINTLNRDRRVTAILVQNPLPAKISQLNITAAISPEKDVDGTNPKNLVTLLSNGHAFTPCTPSGIIKLIENTQEKIEGMHAVIIGRSIVVGKPLFLMLSNKNVTVTLCHSYTTNLQHLSSQADILIAAIGQPEFVKDTYVKKGAIVIDVGTNRMPDGSIRGDVDFEAARQKAKWITPVPGGVGPMTVAMLMQNIMTATKHLAAHHQGLQH